VDIQTGSYQPRLPSHKRLFTSFMTQRTTKTTKTSENFDEQHIVILRI